MGKNFFTELLKAIFSMNHISGDWLKFSDDTTLALVRNVWGYIGMFGLGMTLVYFLIEINNKLALEGMQNMTFKTLLSPFLKLFIAVVILHNSGHIVNALLNINNTMVDWAADSKNLFGTSEVTTTATGSGTGADTTTTVVEDGVPEESRDVYDALIERYHELGFVDKIVIIIVTLVLWLVSAIMWFIWVYKAITYKLEVLWRVAITPVALADVYSGNHSNAFRWLKGFLGLSLYAIALMSIPILAELIGFESGNVEVDWSVWECLKCLLGTLIAPFAALGVTSTIKQVCKEAMG